jgi:hypothetical protein
MELILVGSYSDSSSQADNVIVNNSNIKSKTPLDFINQFFNSKIKIDSAIDAQTTNVLVFEDNKRSLTNLLASTRYNIVKDFDNEYSDSILVGLLIDASYFKTLDNLVVNILVEHKLIYFNTINGRPAIVLLFTVSKEFLHVDSTLTFIITESNNKFHKFQTNLSNSYFNRSVKNVGTLFIPDEILNVIDLYQVNKRWNDPSFILKVAKCNEKIANQSLQQKSQSNYNKFSNHRKL